MGVLQNDDSTSSIQLFSDKLTPTGFGRPPKNKIKEIIMSAYKSIQQINDLPASLTNFSTFWWIASYFQIFKFFSKFILIHLFWFYILLLNEREEFPFKFQFHIMNSDKPTVIKPKIPLVSSPDFCLKHFSHNFYKNKHIASSALVESFLKF